MDIGKEQHLKKKTYQVTIPVSRMFGMEYSDLEALQLTYCTYLKKVLDRQKMIWQIGRIGPNDTSR